MKKRKYLVIILLGCLLTLGGGLKVLAAQVMPNLVEPQVYSKEEEQKYLDALFVAGPDTVYLCEKETALGLNYGKLSSNEKIDPDKMDNIMIGASNSWKCSGKQAKVNSDSTAYSEELEELLLEYGARFCYRGITLKSAGTVTISCRIVSQSGASRTLTKKIHIIKGTPVKAFQIGTLKASRNQRYSNAVLVYTNRTIKNQKISMKTASGWGITGMEYTYQSYIGADPHGHKVKNGDKITLQQKRMAFVTVNMKKKSTGQTFTYRYTIVRFAQTTLKLPHISRTMIRMQYQETDPRVNYREDYLTYNKKSSKDSGLTYKSKQDLVQKFRKYYGFSEDTAFVKGENVILRFPYGIEYFGLVLKDVRVITK